MMVGLKHMTMDKYNGQHFFLPKPRSQLLIPLASPRALWTGKICLGSNFNKKERKKKNLGSKQCFV